MRLQFKTKSKPSQINLVYTVNSPMVVRVIAYDSNYPKTILFDRTSYTDSGDDLLIKMPLSPNKCSILIYNTSGDFNSDGGISVTKSKKGYLKRELTEDQIHDPLFREFVYFIEQFAYHSNYLETEKIYSSSSKHFAIQYLDVIKKSDGTPLPTPAMIKEDSGFMKFSKSRIKSFTVPGIVAIGLHEFSHNFLNESEEDEEEADMNSLITYLGLGFPLVEAYKAWDNIYQYTNTPQNQARSSKITNLLLEYANEYGYNE